MEIKYTPGPWKACRCHEDFDGHYFDIDPDDAESYAARPYTSIQSMNGPVASAHDLFEFTDANARLIAAAPDLLEALQGLCSLAELRPGHLQDYRSAVAHARSAIKKALGE